MNSAAEIVAGSSFQLLPVGAGLAGDIKENRYPDRCEVIWLNITSDPNFKIITIMNKTIVIFIISFNILCGLSINAQNTSLLPAPQKATWGKNKFQIAGAKVFVSSDLFLREQKSITHFIDFVKQSTGLFLSTTYTEDPNAQLIVLKSDQPGAALPVPGEKSGNQSREAYRISVTANK